MRVSVLWRLAYLLIGCSLVLVCSGCWPRPRHGIVLRGDFALELNRIPWLRSREWQYQGEACPGVPSGGPSCQPESVPAGPLAVERTPVACGAGPLAPRGAAGSGGSAEEQAGYHNEPRFHPVPTQPVFSQRGDLTDLAPRGSSPAWPSTEIGPECAAPIEPSSAPFQPEVTEPEVIPTPPVAKPLPAPEATDETTAPNPASSVPSWVFSPPSRSPSAASRSSEESETSRGGWATRR